MRRVCGCDAAPNAVFMKAACSHPGIAVSTPANDPTQGHQLQPEATSSHKVHVLLLTPDTSDFVLTGTTFYR